MELTNILAISGKPNLNQLVSRTKNGAIVMDLVTGQKVRKQFADKNILVAKEMEVLNKDFFEQEEYDLKRFNEIKKYTEDTNES